MVPDGKQIAFSHVGKLGGKGPVTGILYVVNRDGSNLREIIPEKEPLSEGAVWAPSGDGLVYHELVGKNRQIFTIDMASLQASSSHAAV